MSWYQETRSTTSGSISNTLCPSKSSLIHLLSVIFTSTILVWRFLICSCITRPRTPNVKWVMTSIVTNVPTTRGLLCKNTQRWNGCKRNKQYKRSHVRDQTNWSVVDSLLVTADFYHRHKASLPARCSSVCVCSERCLHRPHTHTHHDIYHCLILHDAWEVCVW